MATSRGREGGRASMEVLTEDECLALLAKGTVGRVGVTISAMPAILPVNYALLGRTIVFRTAAGTKLRAALAHTVIAFEVDHIDQESHTGWSVLVVGMAQELTGAQREAALELALDPWAEGERDHVVGVEPDVVSGRSLQLARA